MNEKVLEKKLRTAVSKLGGLALKNASPYYNGMPDRTVLMPEGKAAFAEMKSTGSKPTPTQKLCLEQLRSMGFVAVVIDSQEALDAFIEKIKNL